jgi:eukaryotic-like serine/threonine-protein kinase
VSDVSWPYWPSATVALAHPGLLVAERYQLIEQIGVGAMGAVWLGMDQRLNRRVALKQVVLEPGLDLRQASEARQRILREGRISARLQHPHAVAIYDVSMHDGEPWLVMEYLRARSLANVLTMDGLLTDRAAARIGMQLAEALGAAHRAGIVHRDVKPGNVLICENGTVKLSDFGIARAAGDITVTQTGVLTGTPDYFAPEVARGEPPTPEADMFSLGATLYISVEGEPPFGVEDNALTKMHMVAAGKVRPPRRAGTLTGVLARLLDADPSRRPTAREAREMLADAERGIEQPTRVPPPRRTSPRPVTSTRATPAPTVPPAVQLGAAPSLLPPTPGPHRARHGLLDRLGVSRAPVSLRRRRRGSPVRRSVDGGSWRRLPLALAGVVVLAAVLAGVVAVTHSSASSTRQAAAAPATAADLTGAVHSYYSMLPANPTAAWQLLTPKAQQQAGGFDAYSAYWQKMSDARLTSNSATPASDSVTARLRLTTASGHVKTTDQQLTLVRGPDDRWLIDSFGTR